ncbi:MAG: energy transducer TonB, partial [Lutibacter sp.]|nr:energy transducer TonB [Lutibacter sp.]
AQCLVSQAKEAALKTKWSADAKAPSKQVGTIKYRFSLSQ